MVTSPVVGMSANSTPHSVLRTAVANISPAVPVNGNFIKKPDTSRTSRRHSALIFEPSLAWPCSARLGQHDPARPVGSFAGRSGGDLVRPVRGRFRHRHSGGGGLHPWGRHPPRLSLLLRTLGPCDDRDAPLAGQHPVRNRRGTA